jgi:hypothetical protein
MSRFRLIGGLAVFALVGLAATPAWAQTYQPGPFLTTTTSTSTTIAGQTTTTIAGQTTTTVTPITTPTTTGGNDTTGVQASGTLVPGQSQTDELCGFAPGASVSVTANGQPVGNQTADSNGCVAVVVAVSAGVALGSGSSFPLAVVSPAAVVHILGQTAGSAHAITVNGVSVNGVCGSNSVVGTGANQQGGTLTQTDSFTINCAAAPITGAPGSSSGSGLAVTGANILRFTGAALLLLAFGAILVIADRRRGRAREYEPRPGRSPG